MRRITALALLTGGVLAAMAGVVVAWSRSERGVPGIPKPVGGTFANGMAYLRWGSGPKTLLWIVGGPGLGFPIGLRVALLPLVLRPFAQAGYTCWLVNRQRGMPEGRTIADMAEDHAALIADELGGKVDLVLGEDYGGWIGLYLAARHPERLGYLANASTGYAMTERGRAIDRDFATLVGQGRSTEAWAQMLSTLAPDLRPPALVRAFARVLDRLFTDRSRPDFVSNLIVETEAEDFDARGILPDIRVPVLLIGGDQGPFFSREILEETARLIPDCTLQLHEGKSDAGAVSSMQLPRDVLAWVDERARVQEGRAAEPPTADGEPARTRIHQDTWIAAPVEEVFALYCDATRWRELAGADMGEIASVSGPIDQVGTTFEGTMRIAGRKITGTGRIVEVEPPRLVRVQATGPGAMAFVYRFEPEGDGTRFSVDAEYDITSALGMLTDKVVLHGSMDRAMRHMTGRMKEMAEAKVPAAT